MKVSPAICTCGESFSLGARNLLNICGLYILAGAAFRMLLGVQARRCEVCLDRGLRLVEHEINRMTLA